MFQTSRPVRLSLAVGAAGVLLTGAPAWAADLSGTDGPDVLAGTLSPDVIQGLAGGDVLRGRAGGDRMFGGEGSDDLYGQPGKDFLDGGPGDDWLDGGTGPDVLTSVDAGTDFLNGGDQDDILTADAGNATIRGDAGDDYLGGAGDGILQFYGGEGADELELVGTYDDSTASGGPGQDHVQVTGTTGTVRGGTDADRIFVSAGGRVAGALIGGDGDDTISAQNGDADEIRCGPGVDTVHVDLDDTLSDCEIVFHRIEGTGGDDDLVGTQLNDVFVGLASPEPTR